LRRSLLASGTLIALAFGGVILVGVLVVGLYKAHEAGLPPASATFQRWPAAPANATVHPLNFTDVHARDSFLEDHLDTALQRGSSSEAGRLRVESMRATLLGLTRDAATTLFVAWEGQIVQVSFSGVP
jgi:hypothetical protein